MSQIRARHSAVRSLFVLHVKERIGTLYDLPQEQTAIVRRVDYLCERDRFMCSPRGYEVSVHWVVSLATTNAYAHDLAQNEWIPRAPDARDSMGTVFQRQKMFGSSEPDFLRRINGIMVCLTCAIMCHTLRAWQMGVHLETCNFKPEAVAGEPDP